MLPAVSCAAFHGFVFLASLLASSLPASDLFSCRSAHECICVSYTSKIGTHLREKVCRMSRIRGKRSAKTHELTCITPARIIPGPFLVLLLCNGRPHKLWCMLKEGASLKPSSVSRHSRAWHAQATDWANRRPTAGFFEPACPALPEAADWRRSAGKLLPASTLSQGAHASATGARSTPRAAPG